MQKKDDLIRENEALRARLEAAERWMRREIESAKVGIQKKSLQKDTRGHFSNFFEQEGKQIIEQKIDDSFWDALKQAPKYTRERLIDAEIYWETLQKYPTMDGLPIVLAYQKILDAWIEEVLIQNFREMHKNTSMNMHTSKIDVDIYHIVTKKYTLSIGRLYQILTLIRSGTIPSGWVSLIVEYWKKHLPKTFDTLISDAFFFPFSTLIEWEVFSRKRHEGKVSFGEAQKIRTEILPIFTHIF